MDKAFVRGMAEAEVLWKELATTRREREEKGKGGGKGRPPPYVKLKTNRVVGDCAEFTVSSEGQECDCNPHKENPCGEESNCINRMLMYECDPHVCEAAKLGKCQNQRFAKRQYPALQVHRSEGRGWGLKSTDPIKKGEFVVEYVGEMITMAEYRRRMAANQAEKEENYYYLAIDSNRMIDAGPKGNVARFMNHSCAPNCITQKWTVNGDIRVGLFAVDDIKPGEELTFNYQFETVGDVQKKCLCGAPNCTGSLGGKQKKEEKISSAAEKVKKKKKLKKKRKIVKKLEKVWEEVCFRCTETGNLLKCEFEDCPKVRRYAELNV